MFYEFAITVTANTLEATPKTENLHLAHGIIHRIDVQFPIGCVGLVKCRLWSPNFGSLPSNPSGYFASDGYIITQEDSINFLEQPYEVRATLWSAGTTYDHIVTIRFGIVENKFALLLISVVKGLQKFLQMVGIKV